MSRDDVGVPTEDVDVPSDTIPKQLAAVLAPIDQRAFGVAIGTACGLGIFLLTAADLLRRPEPGLNLPLLGHYFPGYSLSWAGAVAGLAWAFGVGFCVGWFLAFVRNLAIAAWILVARSRHEIVATRDFLDHM